VSARAWPIADIQTPSMPKQKYRKLDIAFDYMAIAAELYSKERYFPSLALAAMAEEIFEAVMRARNAPRPLGSFGMRLVPYQFKPISRDLIAVARALNPSLRGLKDVEVYRRLYRVKNSAKHGIAKDGRSFDLSIDADPELEAWSMLGRAIENSLRLHYVPQGAAANFFQLYQQGRKTWHHEGSSEGPHAEAHAIPTPKPWK